MVASWQLAALMLSSSFAVAFGKTNEVTQVSLFCPKEGGGTAPNTQIDSQASGLLMSRGDTMLTKQSFASKLDKQTLEEEGDATVSGANQTVLTGQSQPPSTQRPLKCANESTTRSSNTNANTHEDAFDKVVRACLVAARPQQCLMSQIMTDAAPFYLADYDFGGSEARKYRWERPDGNRLVPLQRHGALPLRNGSVIHVQTSALEDFRKHVLPRVRVRVVLIVGMSRIAMNQYFKRFANVRCLKEIVSNSWVVHVFMQNPELHHVDYTALPYGLFWRSIVYAASHLSTFSKLEKTETWYGSYVSYSAHRIWRPRWWLQFSGKHKTYEQHIKSTCTTLFVGTPGGDRPDTYRTWEAIACNALPVSNIKSSMYRQLYGDDMVYTETESDLRSLLKMFENRTAGDAAYHKPVRQVLLTSWWQWLVAKAVQKNKGSPLQTCEEH